MSAGAPNGSTQAREAALVERASRLDQAQRHAESVAARHASLDADLAERLRLVAAEERSQAEADRDLLARRQQLDASEQVLYPFHSSFMTTRSLHPDPLHTL